VGLATKLCSQELLEKVQSTTKAIEIDVDNFQGKRDELPLFLLDPAFGERAELLLVNLERDRKVINQLARTARKQAFELYGADVLLSCRPGSNVLADMGDAAADESMS
jgi:hypothetical protein